MAYSNSVIWRELHEEIFLNGRVWRNHKSYAIWLQLLAHYQPQVLRGEWGSVLASRRLWDLPCDPRDRTRCCSPSPTYLQGPYWPNLTKGSQRTRQPVVNTAQPSRARTEGSHMEKKSGRAHGRQQATKWPLTEWPECLHVSWQRQRKISSPTTAL